MADSWFDSVDITEQSVKSTHAPLTERPMGIIALFLSLIILFIYLTNGTLIILLFPTFILILFAREILDKEPIGQFISAERTLSRSRVVEGDELEIIIKVTNNSDQASHAIELSDPVLPEVKIIEGTNLFLFSLDPHETIILSYTVKFYFIGTYRFDELYLRHRDFLGLRINEFRLSQLELPSLQKYVSVVPRLEKVESLPAIKTEWMRLYGGYFQSKHIGHDSDFRGIRDFQLGDGMNRINWKASTRKLKLLSNEYNWDKAIHAEIILDTTVSAAPVWVASLRAVTSLTEFLLRMRNSVGFSSVNEFPEYLDSRIGKKQLLRITNKLLNLRPTIVTDKEILLRRLSIIMNKFDSKAIIILISPFTFQSTIEYAVNLRKHGFNVLAIIPLSLEKQSDEIIKIRDYIKEFPLIHEMVKAELRFDRLKIRNKLKLLEIPHIEWDTSSHFGSTMQHIRRI
ncbi:MAG: hypothetical protein HeimC3_15140 [Candidatus Heimdallarchaeota archaeon LC_3]|nr:MAG: hypothetical protein HeimC3_15140 [Candidatus Heimdallarchaeota archaeon LC_3]